MYSDITIFLKNEYMKIDILNRLNDDNNNNYEINTKLNLLILDKIKFYCEDTFNYISNNINDLYNKRFFKEKLKLLINNISDYKKNFYIDDSILNININEMNNNNNITNNNIINNNNYNKSMKNIFNSEDKMNNIASKSFIYNNNNNNRKNKENEKINKIEDNKNNSMINNNNINFSNISLKSSNSFNNFYSQYNPSILNGKLNTPFANEFFSYKKNKFDIDSKLNFYPY
jgi:hypothetical protein